MQTSYVFCYLTENNFYRFDQSFNRPRQRLVFRGTFCQFSEQCYGGYVFKDSDDITAPEDAICIHGAREHNLKNLSLSIPRNEFVVITGVSGSGKSTLAFDLLFAEGQRRFLDSMNVYARQFVEQLSRPDVDLITGIPPTVSIEQRTSRGGGKSTVATVTEIYHFIRLLFARLGNAVLPRLPVAGRIANARRIGPSSAN